MALRNEEKYAEAKDTLEKAKTDLGKDDKAFLDVTEAALKEASNPGALYLARAEALRKQGKYDEAVAALTHALNLVEDKGKVLAQRSLVRLEAARVKAPGRLTGDEPALIAAQQDAKAASDSGVALGFYAAGRIAEELGHIDAAVQSYRQAVAAQPELAGDGSLFRVALARVLLLQTKPAAPKELPKLGRLDASQGKPSLSDFLALLSVTLQAPPGAEPSPSVEEAVKLADEILKQDPAKVPYEVRARALGIKSLWTEAVRTYALGLRANLDREHADELLYILDHHPKLKGPDISRIPNPLLAEAHYGAGIRQYFDHRYADAEKEFAEAVKNESQDARYHYFLGLARLAQKKNEAYEDFVQGAILENQGRPSRAISTASGTYPGSNPHHAQRCTRESPLKRISHGRTRKKHGKMQER